MVGGLEQAQADLTDPVCALAIEHGHVVVLTPHEPVEMANSPVEEPQLILDEVAAEAAPDVQPEQSTELSVADADEAKPVNRKKSAPQESKE